MLKNNFDSEVNIGVEKVNCPLTKSVHRSALELQRCEFAFSTRLISRSLYIFFRNSKSENTCCRAKKFSLIFPGDECGRKRPPFCASAIGPTTSAFLFPGSFLLFVLFFARAFSRPHFQTSGNALLNSGAKENIVVCVRVEGNRLFNLRQVE